MKTKTLIVCGGIFAAAIAAPAQSSATSDIEGRVFNAATGAALHHATVRVTGTGLETTTDEFGGYRLTGVAPGEAQLSVIYAGLEPDTATVSVRPGVVARRDFDLKRPAVEGIVKLGAVTVVEDRLMSARAVAQNERRNAGSISQVVDYDEYGDRAPESIGEMMRFLPGVAVDMGGQVAGAVSLRGFPAENSNVNMDGAQLASARGNSREISLLDVPTAGISRIEINKLPVPDMPASGMGGSINIVTKNGFDAKVPTFDYKVFLITDQYTGLTLDGGRRGLTDKLSPKYQEPSFDFTYLRPVSKELALSFAGSRSWRLKPMEGDDHLDTQADWNFLGGFQRMSTWYSLDNILESKSWQVGAVWKISDRDVLNASFKERFVSNNILRLIYQVNYGAGATGDASFTQGASTAVGSVSQAGGTNRETGADTSHLALKYTHRGQTWRIDALVAGSRSKSFNRSLKNGHFDSATSTISGLILRGDGIGQYDPVVNIPVRYTATTRTGAPVDIFSGANFVLGNPTSSESEVATTKRTGQLDLRRSFDGPLPFSLKTGLYVDQQIRDQETDARTFIFTPNGSTASTAKLATNFDVFDSAFNASAPTIFGQKVNWISVSRYYDLMLAHPDWFPLNEALYIQNFSANSRYLEETISAAYVRGDLSLLNNRLLVIGGVRLERTADEGQGQLNDPNALYQKDANGNIRRDAQGRPILITTDSLAQALLRYRTRGAIAERTYSDFYPSLALTYKLGENLLLRGGYAETIARPNLNNIIPGTSIPDPASSNLTITVNNTGLKPWTARSYDLSLEAYQIKGGYGSVGVFQRDIEGFFNSVTTAATPELLTRYGLTDAYLGYDIRTLTNGGSAKMTGLEFAYNQELLFLPSWARGIEAFVNATKVRLAGGDEADFSGYAPTTWAGGIKLVRPRYYVRFTFNYQSETRNGAVGASAGNGIPNGIYNYTASIFRVSVNAQYNLTNKFAAFFSMTDINEPGFNKQDEQFGPNVPTPDYTRPRRRQNLGGLIMIGVKGQL